jgi:hypothetical protein
MILSIIAPEEDAEAKKASSSLIRRVYPWIKCDLDSRAALDMNSKASLELTAEIVIVGVATFRARADACMSLSLMNGLVSFMIEGATDWNY